MFKKLMCILLNRHEPLLLNALDKNPLITISDSRRGIYLEANGNMTYQCQHLLEVHMCQNCHLVYWKPSE